MGHLTHIAQTHPDDAVRSLENPMTSPQLTLPPGFLVGTATAAAQIEGGVTVGRRTPSVWDAYADLPGRIFDATTPAVTADHYHRFPEDVALMSELGADAYRFSLSSTRLQPGGRGPLDPEGVAFYDRLLDELAAAGISPFVTISHWDLPVEYSAGWLDRNTALRLGDFAGLVGERFGDRVDAWITVNEPATVTLNGGGCSANGVRRRVRRRGSGPGGAPPAAAPPPRPGARRRSGSQR